MHISLKKSLNLKFEDAVQKVTEELKKQGFGIISSIDVQDIIKKKLNKDFRKFIILGACNPEFAHKAIEINDEVSILLPCNVVIQQKGSEVEVMIFNPEVINILFNTEDFKFLSDTLKKKMEEIIKNL